VLGEHVWVRPTTSSRCCAGRRRFGAPLADVVRHALPNRTVDVERGAAAGWFPPGRRPPALVDPPRPGRARRRVGGLRRRGRALLDAVAEGHAGSFLWRPLPGEDVAARLAELVQLTLAGDRDVLVVVPDPASPVADAVVAAPGTSPSTCAAGPRRGSPTAAGSRPAAGVARVVVGERGAAFTRWSGSGSRSCSTRPTRRSRSGAAPATTPARWCSSGPAGPAGRAARRHRAVGGAWRLLRERRVTPVVPAARPSGTAPARVGS
jgi:primosomal protein N' (replication factor Y) (superfamily II helicase)